jgi:hypothetical protein
MVPARTHTALISSGHAPYDVTLSEVADRPVDDTLPAAAFLQREWDGIVHLTTQPLCVQRR